MNLRDYACECKRRSCRERIYMTPPEYREAAALGRVVTPEHADALIVRVRRVYRVVEAEA